MAHSAPLPLSLILPPRYGVLPESLQPSASAPQPLGEGEEAVMQEVTRSGQLDQQVMKVGS